ncbi:hypothetical protein VCSRO83_0910 [Vibrio cholerae]|nr:hypothetical protein VCSRO83_0910 [Vibrio cholerae]
MNKQEIQAYQSAFEKFNPFYGVDFPITSVKLCELINKMRNDYNEKVVELQHKHLMDKIREFSEQVNEPNFRLVESLYKDTKGEDRKCYLLDKTECRAIAATESKAVCFAIMVYLDQLEQIFEKAKEAKATVFDRKLEKQGVTWREACKAAGIEHPDLALKYMVKRGYFKRDFDGGLIVKPSLLANKEFKKADNLGINKEGFRVLTNGFKRLQVSVERINWQCLQFSDRPKLKAMYKAKLEEHEKNQSKASPKVYDEQGFEVE